MKLKILVFVSILLSINSFSQTNLFVAVNGSDLTGTGTISNPYKTIEKGALKAALFITSNPTTAVNVLVRAGLFRNPGFSTFSMLSSSAYDPQNIGEPIWKNSVTNDNAVRLSNIDGNPNAWITIKPYNNESVVFEGDADVTFNIRNCSYLKIQGFEIKGIVDNIPLDLSWEYWGTYRYDNAGSWVYGDRKLDICATYSLSNCSQIPPIALTTNSNYVGLSNISSLNVQRPNIFGGKGMLVNLSNHIEISDCTIHHFPGEGLRVTGSDYVNILRNQVHHNSSRASVGTHGLVIEGLDPDSGDNSATLKCLISGNTVYSNYNEIYSWVQTKTICTTVIDEGKGIALLRTGSINGFNGIIRVENNIAYDNGKSGIHANDVDNAIIINNTVYGNAHTNVFNSTLSGGTNAGISIQSSNGINITNNIAVVPNGLTPNVKALSQGQNCLNPVVSNNIVFGGGTSDFAGGYSVANPLFVNEGNLNFNLQAASPAINAGTSSSAPVDDFTGFTRVGLPDVGAYEYTCSGTTIWNGSAWNNGLPTITTNIIFSGNYSSSSDLTGCTCLVSSGNVVINTGHTLSVKNDVKVTSGTLRFEDGSSLVQTNDASSANNGNITYKRKTAPLKQYDYTYWSSPVANATLSQLATNSMFYSFSPTINNWNYQIGSTTMTQGLGYIGRAPNNLTYNPTQIVETSFVGVPNNGVILAPIIKNTGTYNLIGNPYPSAIDVDLFITANTSVTNGTVYFWTHNTPITSSSYTTNDYAKYNLTGAVRTSTSAISGGALPTGKIAAGQGFFIEAKTSLANGNYSAIFNNSMRIAANNNQFYKSTNSTTSNSISEGIERHRIWISLSNSSGAFSQMLYGYVQGATDEFDSLFDGKTFPSGNSVSIYTKVGTYDLSIQGKNLPFSETDAIPISYSSTVDGELNINLDDFDGVFNNQEIYLLDKESNTLHDLKIASYNFVTTSGTYDNRFEIRFNNQTLGTTNPVIDENIKIISNTNGQFQVLSLATAIKKIAVYDVLGKLLFSQSNLNTNLFQTTSLNVLHQILLIKVTLDNQKIIARKTVIQ